MFMNSFKIKYGAYLTGLILAMVFGKSVRAQNNDSMLVSGLVKWSNDSIFHYPDKVIIKSKYDPTLIRFVAVDSTGRYQLSLPVGEYVVFPFSNYHWQRDWDQDFIRINEISSKTYFKIDSSTQRNHHTL